MIFSLHVFNVLPKKNIIKATTSKEVEEKNTENICVFKMDFFRCVREKRAGASKVFFHKRISIEIDFPSCGMMHASASCEASAVVQVTKFYRIDS